MNLNRVEAGSTHLIKISNCQMLMKSVNSYVGKCYIMGKIIKTNQWKGLSDAL